MKVLMIMMVAFFTVASIQVSVANEDGTRIIREVR